ncbi:MAG: MFS transporter [Thermodesulfobacteriota bacterium]|nr:MFS transporter [Thermodesulfobacteriota bacterium]
MVEAHEKKSNYFYGWVVLAVATMVASISYMVFAYAFGPVFKPMLQDLGWTRAQLAFGMTGAMILYGLLSPVVGILVDRLGSRLFIIIGNSMLALGLILMQFVQEIWHFYVIYGLLLGLGASIGTYTALQPMVVKWFFKKRSLALGVLGVGGGSGLIYGPIWTTFLINHWGWRGAFTGNGILVLIASVIIGGILCRNKPEDMGQKPDGVMCETLQDPPLSETKGNDKKGSEKTKRKVHATSIDWEVRDALKTTALWLISVGYLVNNLALNVITVHFIPFCTDVGISSMMAATVMGIIGIFSLIGRFGFGILGDKVEPRYLFSICLTMVACGLFVLMLPTTLLVLIVSAVILGAGYGAVVVLAAAMLGNYYGSKRFATLRGFIMLVVGPIGAFGAPFAGWVYDVAKSYNTAFLSFAVLCLVGMLCLLFARPPKPDTGSVSQ